ncbi:tape measure protein [Alcaligenes nematophilus]
MAQESRLTITLDTRSAEQGAKDLTLALNAMEAAGIRVAAMSDRVNGSMAGVSHATLSSAASAAVMDRVLKSALSSFSAMDLIEMAEQWDSYAERMAVATQSLGEYDQAQARVAQLAQATSRPIDETREAFIALSPALREIGLGFDQSMDAVGAFSGLLATNGASADSGAVAMEAFANSFRTGAVNASDWAQITGTVDSLISHMADSTGKTTAEIDQLGRSGQMSAQMLAQGLASSYIPALQQLELMPKTVSGALTNLNSAFSEYVGNTNNSLQATTLLASGINFISQNFESFADVLGTVALGALGVYTSRTIGAVAASVSATVASHTKAAATLAAARAEAQAAAAALASAQANLGLTTTHAQVATAKLADEAATKRLVAVQSTSVSTGRALLGVLGGPVGLGVTAALAAGSFLLFSNNANTAEKSANSFRGSVDLLSVSLNKMGRAALENTKWKIGEELVGLGKDIAFYKIQLQSLGSQMHAMPDKSSPLYEQLSRQSRDLFETYEVAMTRAEGLRLKSEKITELLSAPISAGVEQASEDFVKFESQIDRQIALTGKASNAALLRYDLEKGLLGKMSDEEHKRALEKIEMLEAVERAEEAARNAAGADMGSQQKKGVNPLVQGLQDQVAVLGMSEREMFNYQLRLSGASEKEMGLANALFETKEAFEQAKVAQDAYKSLMLELSTEEERSTDTFKNRVRVLNEAGLSADEYSNAIQKLVQSSISVAPQFNEPTSTLGGGIGELLNVTRGEAALDEWRAKELAEKAAYFETLEGMEEEHAAAILEINTRYNEQQSILSEAWRSATLSSFSTVTSDAMQMLKALGQEGSTAYKVLFYANKAASIAQAIINTEVAYTQAMAIPGGKGLAIAPWIRGMGYASVAMIAATSLSGMAHDGLDQIPREGTWLLDKGERVLSSRQNNDLTSYLQRANKTSAGGAQSAPINVEVNISSNGSAQMQTSGGSQADARQLGELIAGQVQKVLASEMRQGGLLWNQQQGYA